MSIDDFRRAQDQWHLEMAMVAAGLVYVLRQADLPEGLSDIAHVLELRSDALIESFPFVAADFEGVVPLGIKVAHHVQVKSGV